MKILMMRKPRRRLVTIVLMATMLTLHRAASAPAAQVYGDADALVGIGFFQVTTRQRSRQLNSPTLARSDPPACAPPEAEDESLLQSKA